MALLFSERNKEGRVDFHPGPLYVIDDPDAVAYLLTRGVATEVEPEPGQTIVTISAGELEIHPLTVWNEQGSARHGHYVMPDRAAEHRGITLAEAEAFVWAGQEIDQHG